MERALETRINWQSRCRERGSQVEKRRSIVMAAGCVIVALGVSGSLNLQAPPGF
jgi:hypothetical protein